MKRESKLNFYKKAILLALPIMIQNGITNLVGLLDNVMVGTIGTEQMSGVSIVNQLIFVFNICIFGGVAGASIFGAQFYGQKNYEGMKHTFRFKIIVCILTIIAAFAIFVAFGGSLIGLYLHDSTGGLNTSITMNYAKDYLWIMLLSLVPFALGQAYAGTLREMGQTLIPMIGGVAAVLIDVILNYVLIFGKFGAPKLGVEGAAITTVTARIIEAGIVIVWTHMEAEKYVFIKNVYRNFSIPAELAKKLSKRVCHCFLMSYCGHLA